MEAKKTVFVPPQIVFEERTAIKKQEFAKLAKMIEDCAGISLKEEKAALVQSRLLKRLRNLDMQSFSDYIEYIESGHGSDEIQEFVNALTTNKTEFFRERNHFQYLQEYCVKNKLSERVYVWSAASCTGEEIYSIAMLLNELREQNFRFDFFYVIKCGIQEE